ncbi:MAG: family 10 glycosylhydrolase [Lentisphaeria bacterium]|jgi:uncharacterized lipoprotein YddW (UPF0748 family)|nr:family 10 glycosylhydrolase [Lentisphaeria bacterium]
MRAALVSVLLVSGMLVADPGTWRIGVFDTRQAGGEGTGAQFAVAALEKAGYKVRTFADFSPLTLAQFDILWLADMHAPGPQAEDWRQQLTSFVAAGGGVLQTWHHHVLGDVGIGVRRVFDSRRMTVLEGHPVLAGMADFSASYKDHIVEKVGPQGTVLVQNEYGDPVVVVGTLGKGRVASTGLALAIAPNRPRDAEWDLVQRLLAWVAPTVPPAERFAGLGREARLSVVPQRRLVAAGLPARFSLTLVVPGKVAPQLSLDGKPLDVVPESRVQGQDFELASYEIAIPTAPGRNGETIHQLRVQAGDKVLEQAMTVTALHVPPVPGERRGVWLHVGQDRHPERVMPELKALGLDMAVLRIAGGTAGFYASKVQPDVQDPLAESGGDWLAEAVRHAHANGIEIHPYVNNCIVEGRTSPASLERLRGEQRLQQSPEGQEIAWFCPSSEENLAAIERPMVEIVSRYPVDGIQYDFIRYPNAQGCFCPRCRALFEKESGKAVPNWPGDVAKGGGRYDEWIEFRCRRISAIVERVSGAVRKANPKVKISAAVFRDWPACRETNGQDWPRWCREGWLDFVCPMNYTNSDEVFLANCTSHRAALPEGFPVVQGIGINSGNSRMTDPGQLLLQVMLARQQGAVGFVGFCYIPEHTTQLHQPLVPVLD